MPALPAAPEVIRVALIGKLDEDSDVVTRFYMRYFTGTPPVSLNTAAAAIATRWNTDLAAMFSLAFTLTEVDLEDLTSSTSPVGANVTSHAGTRGGVGLSASACALVRYHVGRRYRGGHPRAYLAAGGSGDLLDRQTWTTAFLAALVTAWTTFVGHVATDLNTAYGATDFAHVNLSYYAGFHNVTYPSGRTYPRPLLRGAPVIDNVTSYTANPKVASQRRRNLTP